MKTEDIKTLSDCNCPCGDSCPLGKALSAIGGKWKLRLICTLYVDGTQRYNDLLKKTGGITNTMLATSLKELEAEYLANEILRMVEMNRKDNVRWMEDEEKKKNK